MNSSFFSFTSPSQSAPPVSAGPSRLIIRAAQQQDLHALAEVLTHSFHSQQGWKGLLYPLLKLGIYEDLRSRLKNGSPHFICLVAIALVPTDQGVREEVAGTVEMSLSCPHTWLVGQYQSTYISNLAVSPPYRRQGIARKLLYRCEQKTLEWGFEEIYLHVLEDNEQARQLYTSCGYQRHRTEPSYSAWLFSRPRRLLMGKHLKKL